MKKINYRFFIKFTSTYFIVIILVLFAISPIYLALQQAEQKKVTQSILNHAEGNARELENMEDYLFYTVRNLYESQELRQLYYNNPTSDSPSLFYEMSLLHQRMKLYFQNLDNVKDVIVYIPKFDYVLTQQYIFRTKAQFYQMIQSSEHKGNDWLEQFLRSGNNKSLTSDEFTDLNAGTAPYSALNYSFSFPMNGDSSIKLLVMVSLDSCAAAKQFLLPEHQNQGTVVIKDTDGVLLAASPKDIAYSSHNSEYSPSVQFTSNKGKQISIDIDPSYFKSVNKNIMHLIIGNIGVALFFGLCISIVFAWTSSRPIDRIMQIIRKGNISAGDITKLKELEHVVGEVAVEIHQYKNTIQDLDSIVNNSLLDRLFFGEFEQAKLQEAFAQYYGPMPPACLIVVFGTEDPLCSCELLKKRIQEELISLKVNLYVIHHNKELVYLIVETDPDIRKELELLLKNLRENGDSVIKAGISNTVTSLSHVKKGAQQAQRRLGSGLHIHGIYLFTHTYSSKALYPVSLQSLDMLSKALLTWDVQTANRALEEILSPLEPLKPDAVELRQLFFSLRTIYSTIIHQFILDTDEADPAISDDFILPNDLDEYSIAIIRSTFTNLNTAMHTHYQKNKDKKARIKGMDILAYVEDNFKDPNICANSIAAHFEVSEKYVFQLIKKACGETLNDKISYMRVQEGIKLLENTDMNISEIAQIIGFTSSNSMYKVFMRVNGISPSSYRKKKI
ncbi:MAG: helix-turn-helix transcriptional regulator [Clostridiaceae bacterium]|nr:helix-turn-helix transcriptional regulator [Clostridiaceae bacterium]